MSDNKYQIESHDQEIGENQEGGESFVENLNVKELKIVVDNMVKAYDNSVEDARKELILVEEKIKAISETNFFTDAVNIYKEFNEKVYQIFTSVSSESFDVLRSEREKIMKELSQKSSLEGSEKLDALIEDIDIASERILSEITISTKANNRIKEACRKESESGKYPEIPDINVDPDLGGAKQIEVDPATESLSVISEPEEVENDLNRLFENIKGPEELYEILRQKGSIEYNNEIFKAEDLIAKAKLVLEDNKSTSWATRNIKPLGDILKNIKKEAEDKKSQRERDISSSLGEENQEWLIGQPGSKTGGMEDEGSIALSKKIESYSPEKKKTRIEGIANLGLRTTEVKAVFFKNVFSLLSKGVKNESFDKYLNNFSSKFKKEEEKARETRNTVGRGKLSSLSGVMQGVGNTLRYSRLVSDLSGASTFNPYRFFMLGSMAASTALEVGKDTRLQNEDIIKLTRGEEKDKAVYEEAYNEASKIRESIKNKDEYGNGSVEDIQKAYIKFLPEDIKNRFEKLGNKEYSGVKWLNFLINKDASHFINSLNKKFDKINDLDISEEEKEEKREKLIKKNDDILNDLDRMVSREGNLDGLAYSLRLMEKGTKAARNVLTIETAGRYLHTALDYFNHSLVEKIDDTISKTLSQLAESEQLTHGNVKYADVDKIDMAGRRILIDHPVNDLVSKESSLKYADADRDEMPKGPNSGSIDLDNDAINPSEIGDSETESIARAPGAYVDNNTLSDNDIQSTGIHDSEAESIDRSPLAYLDNINIPEQHEVLKGESVWGISKSLVSENKEFSSLSEGQQTHVIDRIKDTLVKQADQKGFLKEGQVLELDKIKPDDINEAILEAKGFSTEKIAQIEKNNGMLRDFIKNNPEAPRSAQNYEAILKGEGLTGREQVLDNASVERIIDEARMEGSMQGVDDNIGPRIDKIYNKGSFWKDQIGEWEYNKDLKAEDVLGGKFSYPDRLNEPRTFEFSDDEGDLGDNPDYQDPTTDKRDTYLGNQLDQVELNNREQLTDFLKEAQEKIGSPGDSETVDDYLERYNNEIGEQDASFAETFNKDLDRMVQETSLDRFFVEKYNDSYQGLNYNSRIATMEIRSITDGDDYHFKDIESIDKMFNGNIALNKDNIDLEKVSVNHFDGAMYVNINDSGKYIKIFDDGRISAFKEGDDGVGWKPESENKKVSDENVKKAFEYIFTEDSGGTSPIVESDDMTDIKTTSEENFGFSDKDSKNIDLFSSGNFKNSEFINSADFFTGNSNGEIISTESDLREGIIIIKSESDSSVKEIKINLKEKFVNYYTGTKLISKSFADNSNCASMEGIRNFIRNNKPSL